ncbi:MAG: hypothetical protein IJI06_09725 [Oscillospiraceae bacterium]|nr:hypothetical protein [Oscillospiraceae bacterium]
MRLYKNGDRCPCCGQLIEGKSDDWLLLFSQIVDMLRLPPWEASPLWDGGERAAGGVGPYGEEAGDGVSV